LVWIESERFQAMTDRKRGLGRGLESLIPGMSNDQGTASALSADIDALEPNPLQPRTRWNDDDLESLASSILEHGVIQPIIVTRGNGNTPYQIVAGERRWRAARRAGLSSVPVIIREISAAKTLELALVENLQREDLNPIEEGLAYRQLADEFNLTQTDIAARVGRSRPAISNTLRLLDAPIEVREAVVNNDISAGHARALLTVSDPERQKQLLSLVIKEGLSVRQTERLAKQPQPSPPRTAPPPELSSDERAVENELRRVFGTKVELKRGRRGGTIVVHWYSDEELNAILGRVIPASEDDMDLG
jgi:ParB family transcriptional regulator, chromosome partitioning protein